MTDVGNTLYLWMTRMGEGDKETTTIRPSEMNIPEASIPMLDVEAQSPQIHYGSMHETMIGIMATGRYIGDP